MQKLETELETEKPTGQKLTKKHEIDLIDTLSNFSDVCKKSIINLKPQIMANYL